MKKHEEHNGGIRLASPIPNKNHFGRGYNVDNIHGVFDIRLKENSKFCKAASYFNHLCI